MKETYYTAEGYLVTIELDHNCVDSPRDCDNLGTMACWHGRYAFGDEQPSESPQEYEADLPEGTIVLPLYLYDHSILTMNTTGFSCPWDSRQVGIIYVTPEKIAKEMIPSEQSAIEILKSEVKTYDTYLRGEIYRYTVEKPYPCDHGDTHFYLIESCGGYYGDDGIGEIKSEWPDVQYVTV